MFADPHLFLGPTLADVQVLAQASVELSSIPKPDPMPPPDKKTYTTVLRSVA